MHIQLKDIFDTYLHTHEKTAGMVLELTTYKLEVVGTASVIFKEKYF